MKILAKAVNAIKKEGIILVDDLLDFDNDDINNIVQNLCWLHKIYHSEVLVVQVLLVVQLVVAIPVLNSVALVATVPCVEARHKEQALIVLGAILVKNIKLLGMRAPKTKSIIRLVGVHKQAAAA